MRLLGIGAGLAIAGSLVLITVGLAGGPRAPFISWALLHHPGGAAPGQRPSGGHSGSGQARSAAPGAASPSPSASPQPSPSADPRPSPQPSVSLSPSPGTSTAIPTSTATPIPTNPAGRTPRGYTKTPTPNPHKSTHGP